jgi:hypothetical protein
MIARHAFGAAALIAMAACALTPAPQSSAPQAPSEAVAPLVMSATSLGPIKIGMSLQEAQAAWGKGDWLVEQGMAADPNDCMMVTPKGEASLWVMFEQGKATRFTVMSDEGASSVKTPEGVGLGASPADVARAYPTAEKFGAKYGDPPADDWEAWLTPQTSGYRFEVDKAGQVFAIHAGTGSVTYVEGCA